MSFKGGNIPLSMLQQYKTSDPFKSYAGKPDNPYNRPNIAYKPLDNVSLKNMWKNFGQADMTAYSQGNVVGKK
jgi:hypothetical protein